MNQSIPEAYFSHFHIREILDHFVSTYVREEQNRREEANRSYLLKNTGTDGAGPEGDQSSADVAVAKEVEDEAMLANPQLKAIVLLRQYLENYQREEKEFKGRHPYVIFVSSVLPVEPFDEAAWRSSPASKAMVELATRLSQDAGVSAEVLAPRVSTAESSLFPIDSPERQKILDHERVKKAGEIGGLLNAREKSITIILASEWPMAVADVLALGDVMGQPQLVLHFSHPEDEVQESGGFERNPGEVHSIQDTTHRIHAVSLEAGRFNKPRERSAFLQYFASRGLLVTLEVDDNGAPLTQGVVDLVQKRFTDCRARLDQM